MKSNNKPLKPIADITQARVRPNEHLYIGGEIYHNLKDVDLYEDFLLGKAINPVKSGHSLLGY